MKNNDKGKICYNVKSEFFPTTGKLVENFCENNSKIKLSMKN